MMASLTRIDAVLERIAETRIAAMLFIAAFAVTLFLPVFFALPPVDRDEARFSQASRQMAETGDLIDIRLGDGTRYKKPIGIYWLQTAAVWITGERDAIWSYRLPSLLSATASAVLTYLVALSLMGARPAFLAGLLMATTLALGAEARIAKTDATLLATILLAMWPLARLHMTGALPRPWLFWAALGASMLIKGPIGIMVVGLTVAVLCALRRDIRWLAPLKPRSGGLIFAAIVLPWYIAITFVAGWAFWEEALIGDFLSKIGEGQESHGAPPGSYLIAVWLTFWPAAILLPFGLWYAWTRRAEPAVLFCLAWVLPSWLVFELTATKLLHYVLPLYPALAILTAAGWLAREGGPRRAISILTGAILAIALLIGAAPAAFTFSVSGWPGPYWLLGLAITALGAWVFWQSFRSALPFAPAMAAGILTLGIMTSVFSSLARYSPMWPSNTFAAMVDSIDCPAPRILAAGYAEASLIFLTPSFPVFTDGAGAALQGTEAGCAIAFVDSRQAEAFSTGLSTVEPQEIGHFDGFSLGKGEPVSFTIWAFMPEG